MGQWRKKCNIAQLLFIENLTRGFLAYKKQTPCTFKGQNLNEQLQLQPYLKEWCCMPKDCQKSGFLNKNLMH